MAATRASEDVGPSPATWTILTDLSADVDLTTHAQGSKTPARMIEVTSGGVLVVVKPNGSTETTPSVDAGYQLIGQVQKITAAGTTATAVVVYW